MAIKRLKIPKPTKAKDSHLVPEDFLAILERVPETCPIVGGQAVALWCDRYGLTAPNERMTSRDIDLWGSRSDLLALARQLKRTAALPGPYEMTVWVGAIPWEVQGKETLVEMLHTIPGLDTNDPNKACVTQVVNGRTWRLLTPVSLILAKLHAVRNFDQTDRNDLRHLEFSIRAAACYLGELLEKGEVRTMLREIERILQTAAFSWVPKLAREHRFRLLDAIPLEMLRRAAVDHSLSAPDREKVTRFLEIRWSAVQSKRPRSAA